MIGLHDITESLCLRQEWTENLSVVFVNVLILEALIRDLSIDVDRLVINLVYIGTGSYLVLIFNIDFFDLFLV